MLEDSNISISQMSILVTNSSEYHELSHYLIVISFTTNLLLGLPPHGYILWMSMKEMIRGQSQEIFVFNNSLIEVIFNLSFPSVFKQYLFNCSNCRYVTMVVGLLLLFGRPLFQACICVERYIAVLHPVTFLKLKPMKYRMAISAVGWILIISSCFVVSLEEGKIYNTILAEYLVFLITKVFTCLMVLKALKRPGPGEDVKQRERVNQDKVKAFRIIQIVLVSSLLTYSPAVFCLVFYYVIDKNRFNIYWSVCFCLGVMFGFVQPYLYLKRVRKLCLCFSI